MALDQTISMTCSYSTSPARRLRSQNKDILVQTTAGTKCGESALNVYAAKLWNKLPEEIKNAPTTF